MELHNEMLIQYLVLVGWNYNIYAGGFLLPIGKIDHFGPNYEKYDFIKSVKKFWFLFMAQLNIGEISF